MAELCRKCFIETWRPNAYDIEHIVISEENDFCESCWDCVPYVDYIDMSELRHVSTPDEFARTTLTEVRSGNTIACPECGAVFEEDDFAYAHETGLCQCCHRSVMDIWVKHAKRKMYLGNCEELDCEFFRWSGDSYMDRNATCYCLKNNRCIDRDMIDEEPHIDCPLGKVLENDEIELY